MEIGIIITAAARGSRPARKMNPAVPYSPKEIIQAGLDCYSAGAAMVHVHVRDPRTGQPDFKVELFKEVLDGIREKWDMIIDLTTSGLFLEGPNLIGGRFEPIFLKPDICSLDIGSANFQDRVS